MCPSHDSGDGQLRGSLRQIGQDLVTYLASPSSGPPPYYAYVYSPKHEFAVRQELQRLDVWLRSRSVIPVSISLAELFWRAIDESGYYGRIEQEERESGPNAAMLETLAGDINQILMSPPSLPDRVMAAMEDFPERSVAFLYRAGALYPSYRTSALLDDLRERLLKPVVLLYPGRLVGSYGLSFMGKCEPAHGYRAKIVARET